MAQTIEVCVGKILAEVGPGSKTDISPKVSPGWSLASSISEDWPWRRTESSPETRINMRPSSAPSSTRLWGGSTVTNSPYPARAERASSEKLAVMPEAGRVAWARGSDIRERVKARRVRRSNGRGDVLLRVGLFGWYGFWWRFGLVDGRWWSEGNEFGSFFLEIGGSESCFSLERGGAHVGGEGAWGGVNVGDPSTTADRFRFDGAIEVELELND